MTGSPPPLDAEVRPARPGVPLAVTCLTMLVGAGMLAAICTGGVVLGLAESAAPRVAAARAVRAEAARELGRSADTKSFLDDLAARLDASARGAGEFPETLDEAPPKDPWGRAIEYTRAAPNRALLRSAGPDGKFGSKDDVRRDVVLK